ncbi:restriction endonuclease subunit S [Bifidobacterium longum]|uniref:Restriction endonuclease subunit S n=1 Tax=Bifidobacterium longum TaxID=216816 RepID=A0A7J5SCS1_BIFLN|nr:restriction endonuclease subunit S [Bifidobacterium longum]
MQKMFPRDGSDGPEIRFPGFTDAWEQRKLGEVAKIVGGGTPSTSIPEYWNGDIDWYSPTEIGDSVYAEGSRKRITKSGFQACSATMLPAERTILFTSRAGIGNMAILRRSGCTNQGFQSLVVDDCNDTYFIYSMGDSIKEYAERNASGSTFLEISGKQLACMSTMVPSLSEQALIGSFFRDLDDLITLHQRKLDHLKLQKKALLQQMFI